MILYDIMETVKHNIILHPFTITIFTLFLGVWIGIFIESKIRFWRWSEVCKTCKETIHWDHIAIHCKDCYNEICLDKENK